MLFLNKLNLLWRTDFPKTIYRFRDTENEKYILM